ncbi:MAG TPA: WYL domain-containing protein [Chitinophagaceae bacterium]|nr:WYL domain-containing protein [Chitinophagaceae bacterium]
MSKLVALKRYHLIINKLRKKPADFKEISNYLALESEIQGLNFNISIRTFQRDVNDILSLYGFEISYDNSEKVYYLKSDETFDFTQRIFETFDTFHALQLSERISDHIHFEKRKPLGTENLSDILTAIKNKFQIRFTYEKFIDDDVSKRHVAPYALKEFKNRWYILAEDYKDRQIKSFALDRLSHLEILRQTFEIPSNFDVQKHYENCFGIIRPEGETLEDVVLSFSPVQGKYIKSLPLHESQEIIMDNDEELRVKLKLYITFDFVIELLSYGDRLKVLSPQSLADRLKATYLNALKVYD